MYSEVLTLIIKKSNYWIIPKTSNTVYWGEESSPDWTSINSFMSHPTAKAGVTNEPHYHDADEVWIFDTGRGKVLLDGKMYPVTPNTLVYTPMGSIHGFQMLTEFDNVSVVTKLERQQRAKHLLESIDGPPVPTVPGFIVSGNENNGPIKNTGIRCRFTEIRHIDLETDTNFNPKKLKNNEHWLVDSGKIQLNLDGSYIELVQGDVAMVKTGTLRKISVTNYARVCLVQEKPGSTNI
tara:strand:- start:1643 stop:2353 length:711 start_codon:yes stop_codon:yes gene_type:complete